MGIVVVVARAGLAPSEQRFASVEHPRGAANLPDAGVDGSEALF